MQNPLLLTVIAAILVMGFVVAGLGIGRLITGKGRLRRGCGLSPKKDPKNPSKCPLCGDNKHCDKNTGDPKHDPHPPSQ